MPPAEPCTEHQPDCEQDTADQRAEHQAGKACEAVDRGRETNGQEARLNHQYHDGRPQAGRASCSLVRYRSLVLGRTRHVIRHVCACALRVSSSPS